MSAPPWQATHAVTLPRARGLIADQWPALATAPLVPFGQGWDNDAFLLDDRYVVRFPRRALAVPLMALEARVLPWLATQTGLPIPAPVFVGRPGRGFPAPWAAYLRLPGRTADRVALAPAARRALAEPLGGWLRRLHGVDPAAAAAHGVPGDTLGRADADRRLALAEARLDALAAAHPARIARYRAGLASAYAALRPEDRHGSATPRLVHGDLYVRHLLLDGGAPSGLIDFGDVHLGDPALDLAIGWLLLPPSAHPAFHSAYGGVDPHAWARARFRAVHHTVAVWQYALAVDDGPLGRAAADGLDRVCPALG